MENTLSEDNREALKTFLDRRDRGAAFRFVGRAQILHTIERQLRLTREEGRSLPNADVVQGPPGSGKSVLLEELRKRYQDSDAVVPVMLLGEDMNNQVSVARAFIEACGINAAVLDDAKSETVSGSLGFTWLGGERGSHTGQLSASERIQSGALSVWSALNLYLQGLTDKTFLVLVDETQRLSADTDAGKNLSAIKLADGNTERIQTCAVFGGLSDTSARLKRFGASPRKAAGSTHQLAAFEPQEVFELVSAFLAHEPFGLDALPLNHEATAEKIIKMSDCYPRHVQGYLNGLAQAFCEQPSIDLNRAFELGREHRVSFYEEIVRDAELRDFQSVIGDVVQSRNLDAPFGFEDIAEVAKARFGMARGEVWDNVERAIHSGVLEPDPDQPGLGTPLRFPVPSFRTYVLSGCDRALTLKLLRDVEE